MSLNLSARKSPGAFTLIELLVVVSIIVILIALMVPSLANAKHVTKTVICGTNLKQIDLAMQEYAAEWQDAILGNAWTSGAFLKSPPTGVTYSDSNCPNLCQTWDWTAAVAMENRLSFNVAGDTASRAQRFDFLCRWKGFVCPENDIPMTAFSSSPVKVTTLMLSYNTASMFQYQYKSAGGDISLYQSYINTGSYRPNLKLVGGPANKIFIADGGRWCDTDTTPPDYVLGWDNNGSSPGGFYADYGPWSGYTRAYSHGVSSGDAGSQAKKPITYSMRHGNRKPGLSLGNYKFNAAFFDGHVETMDGRRALNPTLWMPTGTLLPSSECGADAVNAFFKTSNLSIGD